eukprot:scaffold375744_cov122-Cyclotella_meneghiniana.AAC.1
MVWTVAMFEWADRVQKYQSNEWTYDDRIRKFVDGGMTDDSFIMSVARVLTNGCHNVGCSTVETQKPSRSPVQKSKPSIWTATSSTSSTDRAPAESWPTPA